MTVFHHEPTAELQVDNVSQTVVTVTNASGVLLAANLERKYLKIRSQGTGTTAVYIKFAALAATTTNALEILDAEVYEEGVGTGKMIYTGEIRAITASGNKTIYVEERY